MNDGDGLEKRSLLVSHIMSCQKSSFRLNEFEDDVFTMNDEDYSTRCLLFWVKKNLRTFNLLKPSLQWECEGGEKSNVSPKNAEKKF